MIKNDRKEQNFKAKKKDGSVIVINHDSKIERINHKQERLNENELNEFINYLKEKGYYGMKRKEHYNFNKNMIKYKLYIKAQVVMTMNSIKSLDMLRKTGKYYTYEIKKFIDWFKKGDA
jgi:hypothetical protein